MSDEIKFGIFCIITGIVFIYFSLKSIKGYRKEKYEPFRDRESVIKPRMYFQSYALLIFGILLILFSILFLFFS